MDVIEVNWTSGGLSDLSRAERAIDALPLGGCITIMIHGFRFSPADALRSPHHHILSLVPRSGCWKAISWPRHLHLHRADRLGMAFGWPALGRLGPVAARALDAGDGLAHHLTRISELRPDVHVNLFAHSLGARVALRALRRAPTHAVHRAILLSGAEYRPLAIAAMSSPAGRTAQVISVRSSENLPFDLAFRACVPAPHLAALPLSAGLPDVPNWTDLSIDCVATLELLRDLGHRIPAPATRYCHWSGYLRPGLFPLYRRLLDPAQPNLLPRLRAMRPEPTRVSGGAAPRLSPL